jgi:hypothetical protein
MKRLMSGLLLAGALALAGIASADDKKETKVEEGKPAPAIELPATQVDKALPDKKDAKTLSLKELEGKKNVVPFFTFAPQMRMMTLEGENHHAPRIQLHPIQHA